MIKAGYSGSGINEVVYMGEVVNRAAHSRTRPGGVARRSTLRRTCVPLSLDDQNRSFLTSRYVPAVGTMHTGDVVRTGMNE
jgi:hypothetical protein